MTSNMKNETLMNLPVLAALGDAKPATAAPARKIRIGWLVPCVAMLAAIFAYQTLTNLAELNASLDGLAEFMHTAQF
jgi:hypothetical protein